MYMKQITQLFVFFSFCVACSAQLLAQKLLSPEEFMPHKYGEQFTPHNLTVDYFRHAAANSDLIQLKEYGKTNQMRPLLYAIISSKENLVNLEKIRLNNLARAGVEGGKADPSVANITIVWLSMNVHGNEPASSSPLFQCFIIY